MGSKRQIGARRTLQANEVNSNRSDRQPTLAIERYAAIACVDDAVERHRQHVGIDLGAIGLAGEEVASFEDLELASLGVNIQ